MAAESIRLLDRFAAGQVHFSVPDLFWPELGNVLWKAVRSGRISEEAAQEAIGSLGELNIPTSSSRPLIPEALSIAVAFQRPVYDAVYVAMAVALNRPLLTADERLANALAARLPVRWLGSICVWAPMRALTHESCV